MHQFGLLSERRGNFLNLRQKEGVPKKMGGSLRKGGGFQPGGNYVNINNIFIFYPFLEISWFSFLFVSADVYVWILCTILRFYSSSKWIFKNFIYVDIYKVAS